MNLKSLNIVFMIIVILSVILLPVFMGAGIVDLPEEDNLTDDDDFSMVSNFSVAWLRIPVHQMSGLLRLGISIFALFVVYLGGRSKHRRFNDRTIDPISVLKAEFLKTALIRAVFNFLFFILHPLHTHYQLTYIFHPIFIPSRRSTKL